MRTWVRRLCAVLAPEEARGPRVSLRGRRMSHAARGAPSDSESDAERDDEPAAAARPPPAHVVDAWVDGTFYSREGELVYYECRCKDDPYAESRRLSLAYER